MATPSYTRLIWTGIERAKAQKLSVLQDNYEAVRYLWNRTPIGLVGIVSSNSPVTVTANNQVILTVDVPVTAGRLYKVRYVNNNVVYDNANGGLISIRKDGATKRNGAAFSTAAAAGLYNTKNFNTPYALEWLDINFATKVSTYSITASWPSSHNYQLKLDSTTITGFGGSATTLFNATNIGKYMLTVEDKGVVDI